MATQIHLLGPPSIVVDGHVAAPPRGSKSWCLLAYLLLTRRPVPRSRLAALLFERGVVTTSVPYPIPDEPEEELGGAVGGRAAM